MDNYYYICNYCGVEYIPAKRHRQLYCSASCRVRSNQEKKKLEAAKNTKTNTVATKTETTQQKPDKMSMAGVGNVVVGTALVELAKTVIIQSATKKDIETLKIEIKTLANKINRYHKINDLPIRNDGAIPYLDINTNKVVYIMPPKKTFNFI